ncbi:MAG: hypothetical protein LIP01_01345 [Tannerellaceae bacterium]|nr:hypothetical protein [Tannerellaceae bacterium]
MKTTICMIYKEVIVKRLERKKNELASLETSGVVTPEDKRKYVELKARIDELETCIDIAETMFNNIERGDCEK